jgi:site-specific DNA-methyltransferase (adenine-specific)
VEGFDVGDFGFEIDDLPQVVMPTDEQGEGDGKPTHNVEEDDFDPEEVHETKVKRGEIWSLGAHRLMCGDSTKPDDLKRLLGEVTPDLIYTDPPYGMNAVSNSGVLKEKYKTDIHGDDDNTIAIAAFKMCQSMFPNARQVWWGANYYTECLPSSECWLVWDKNNGMSDQTDCELAWANFRSVVRQFTMVSEKTNRIHPTQKPCKLFGDIVVRMKKNETYNNVLDLFGGSGSTMIACEQMGITSFTMEYDPHFCTEIIARWEKLTGQKAIKEQ